MPRFIFPVLILSATLLFMACNRSQSIIPEHTYRIFPNEKGKFRIMYVEDTTFTTDGINFPIVDKFFKKEEIGDTTTDLRGRTVVRVESYTSPEEFGTEYQFTPSQVFTQFVEPLDGTSYFAERIEDNNRTMVLRFPVFTSVVWNGNLFNNLDDQLFTYQSIDTTVSIRGKSYEQCVMVLRERREGIFNIYSYEIYAPDIGLIKKYDRRLIFNSGGGDPFNDSESMIHYEEIVEHN
ncbi:MAG: hypothetical protein MRZ79_11360 [Bacteroidia bacterium]|nr:hypothetical protein [Bacteroidia bacterium]